MNHNANDLDLVESSNGERPSLTIRLGLETPLPWTPGLPTTVGGLLIVELASTPIRPCLSEHCSLRI
jgi:hypothetical protein